MNRVASNRVVATQKQGPPQNNLRKTIHTVARNTAGTRQKKDDCEKENRVSLAKPQFIRKGKPSGVAVSQEMKSLLKPREEQCETSPRRDEQMQRYPFGRFPGEERQPYMPFELAKSTVRTPVQTKRPGSPAMAGEPPTDRSQDTIAALKFHSRAPSATRREADTTMFSFRSNAGEDVQAFSLRQQIQKEIMKRRREQLNDERSSAEPTVSYGAPVSNVYLRRFIEDFASKTHSKVEISLDRTAVSKIQLVSGAPQASTSKKAGFSRLSRAEKPSVVLEETRAKTEKKGNENPLSHLRAEKILGTGTYAVVRMMVDRREGHRFAVKTYDKAKLGDPRKLKNVQREIEVLRLLDHPNVVKLVGDHETPKQIHLIMELKGQTSLYTYLKGQPGRRLPEKEARIIFRQIVEGLSYCHDQDVIHRDLKLENVVLDEANNVKLIDFGFSICIPPTKLLNIFCGTPSYMAPEIISKTPYKGKPTDVWAAGILLFTLLCGSFPFKGSNDQELFKRIQRGKFEMPQHLGPQVSSLLTRLLQVCPRDRIEAKDLLKDTWLNEN